MDDRQKGIMELRDLLYKKGCVLVGDKGINSAYKRFLKRNDISLLPPSKRQMDYCEFLDDCTYPGGRERKKAD